MADKPHLLRSFLVYQQERFPLAVLIPTTLSVALSSYVIASSLTVVTQAPVTIALGVVAAVAYLFHMRAIDEARDRAHDTAYHPSRPIQRGLVSDADLRRFDRVAVTLFAAIALAYGPRTLLLGSAALLYSFVAGKEFFLGEALKRRFLTYNAVNLIQTILLQAFIYAMFSTSWYQFPILWLHLIFVLSNSVLIEFVRKIKLRDEESGGGDTYSWYFGFRKSLAVYSALIAVSYSIFLSIMASLNLVQWSTMAVSAVPLCLLAAAIVWHLLQQDKASEGALQLGTLALYVGLHWVIVVSLGRT